MSINEIASSYLHQFNDGEHDLLAVIGPTASGKTGFRQPYGQAGD